MGLLSFSRRLLAGPPVAAAPPPRQQRIDPVMGQPQAAEGAGDVQHPEQWLVDVIGAGPSKAGVRVSSGQALTLPAVMAAVRILTGVFAMTPLLYYRRLGPQERDRATDSPLYALFHDRPNGVQSPFNFMELALSDVLLAGNHFAFVHRDRRQVPTALTRLDPAQVAVNEYFDEATGSELFYDATLPNGRRARFPASQIWHVPGFTRNGLLGLNPIAYMRDAIGSAIATRDYAARFWSNNAKPSLVLTTPLKISAPAREQIKADWRAKFAGEHAHEIAVLDQDLQPKELSQDNESSQFNETQIFQVVDVARAFGVPPHLIFELSRATFSNIEQMSLEFVTYFMGPHYGRFQGAANLRFAEAGHFFEYMPDALLKGDVKTRWEAYKAGRETGVLSADEIRAKENLNPVGGDAGEERWRPANMQIAGAPPPPPPAPPAAPSAPPARSEDP